MTSCSDFSALAISVTACSVIAFVLSFCSLLATGSAHPAEQLVFAQGTHEPADLAHVADALQRKQALFERCDRLRLEHLAGAVAELGFQRAGRKRVVSVAAKRAIDERTELLAVCR